MELDELGVGRSVMGNICRALSNRCKAEEPYVYTKERYQANFEWMISGFSCQSSILTHICTAFVSTRPCKHGVQLGILTFLNVLSPAKILPPIHVLYLRSGGAQILIRMSFTARRCTSCNNRSPNPFVSVEPPDSTMLPKRDLRRSMSVRLIASTTI